MRKIWWAFPLALILVSAIPHRLIAQETPVRERLGGRIGYVDTYRQVHEHYAAGWNLDIYFTEKLYKALFLDIRIGTIDLGELQRPEVAEPIFGSGATAEMRILYFSVGPEFVVPIGESLHWYAGLGFGVYSTSIPFITPLSAGDFSEQELGGNLNLGLLLRFTATWNLDLNVTVHHFRTSTDPNDLFFVFTGSGASDPVFTQAAIGIAIDLR